MPRGRKLLSWFVALAAVAFFASVACPPLSERTRPLDDAAAAERDALADPEPIRSEERLPAPAERRVRAQDAREQRGDAIDELRFLVRGGETGAPVPGAEVVLAYTGPTGRQFRLERPVDESGRVVWRELALQDYRVWARHPDWLPSSEQDVRVPAPRRRDDPVVLELIPAASIRVRVENAGGGGRIRGYLRLTDLASGEAELLRPGRDGSFRVDPRPAGTWRLAWIAQRDAVPDPRLQLDLELEAAVVYELRLVVAGPDAPAEHRERVLAEVIGSRRVR